MLKKTIEYTDFNGTTRKEDFYFNLTNAELTELEMSRKGGLTAYIERISNTQEAPELIKLFKEECGMTVGAYIAEVRLSEAERLLTGSDASMCEIARECGFCDQSYFSKVFVAKHGISPSDYRNLKQGRKK